MTDEYIFGAAVDALERIATAMEEQTRILKVLEKRKTVVRVGSETELERVL